MRQTGERGINMDTTSPSGAAERLGEVLANIRAAEKEAGRPEGSVTLVAVSKTFDAEDIEPVIAAGQRTFGENRVQESQTKWPGLKQKYPDIELHLIGPLQTNKVKDAVELFDAIETVDRDKLARALKKEMEAQGKSLRLFVQVNTGTEPQKAGVLPAETADFVKRCREEYGLEIEGLMAIPPFDEPPAPHFALLARMAKELGLKTVSMGMSADYEIAVAHGATHVRVGSAIFGARPKAPAGAYPIEVIVSGPIRGSSRTRSFRLSATQPSVASNPSRARCRKMALPKPFRGGASLWPITMTRS